MENTETEKTNNAEILAQAKAEIEAVLLKYKIVLLPVIIHQGEKTISRIDIAPANVE
jgi:hypothetical protein